MFWAVGLGHMTNDTFMSMGPVLLAFLSVTMVPMSNTEIGLTVSATQLLGAVSQPGFGLLADRTGGRWLGAGGVAWTVGFFMLAMVGASTGYFWLMFMPYVLRALGSGAFHPVGAMHAAESDRTRVASSMAYFFLMGQLGLALGPTIAGILLDRANPDGGAAFLLPFTDLTAVSFRFEATIAPIFFVGLMALPVFGWMLASLPTRAAFTAQHIARKQSEAPAAARGALPLKAFAVLGALVALRSLAQPGSVTFIPVLFQQKGWSPAQYGAITSLFWVGSAMAGLIFGSLADRFDRRHVVAVSLLAAAPTFFLLPLADGQLALLLAVLTGALSGGSHSIIVVLAQELIPAAKGFASGAILGFIFATGALGSVLIGLLADLIGLGTTFQAVAGALILAASLALLLPDRQPTPPPLLETDASPAPTPA